MKWIVVILVILFVQTTFAQNENTIYDSNPNHLWNRLNETLFERTAQDGKKYGLDELDILYWFHTTNLLSGVSNQQAINVLDEFINSHGEKLIQDPLKRALLQHDLWELFDWTALPWPNTAYATQRKELQNRLAVVMRRIALSTNEIASLPDNYLQSEVKLSDLPHGLFETNGDWLSLSPGWEQEIAPTHDHSLNGDSAFLVMLHLPDGRQSAISYLNQLRTFEHFWIYRTNTSPFATTNEPHEILTVNPNLPEFPTNTEWALVRRMLIIDADGNIQQTPIVESIQLRRYLAFSKPTMLMITNKNGGVSADFIPPQKFYEFQMNRTRNCELREIGESEKDFLFVHFLSKGFDPFEGNFREVHPDSSTFKRTILDDCRTCHIATGIYSVNSYAGGFREPLIYPPSLKESDVKNEINAVIIWKQQQFSWGLLRGLWMQNN